MASELDLQLVPQGTRADPRRGFRPGLYLDADRHRHAGPRRKATRQVDGKDFLVETALRADFALVQAFIADYLGNLGYALTARNFNPVIAMAADTVIVGADNIGSRSRGLTILNTLNAPVAHERHACQWNLTVFTKCCRPFSIS